MEALKPSSVLLENTWVYRIWQAPFAETKWSPIVRHNDLSQAKRVLDVGCGPGTNTRHFLAADYLGVDINERYIAYARERFGKRFEVADITDWRHAEEPFDFILVNSFLHHIDDLQGRKILGNLQGLLDPAGAIHILDLVLPEQASAARWLARADRGQHARSLDRWRELFCEFFEPILFEPYSISLFGVDLWRMVYFKGRLPVPA